MPSRSTLLASDQAFEGLTERGAAWRDTEGLSPISVRYERSADLRYFGQSFEINLAVVDGPLDGAGLGALVTAFHRRHEEVNGYAMGERPVEIVNLRLAVIAQRPATPSPPDAVDRPAHDSIAATHRQVWFRQTGYCATPIYQRLSLSPNVTLTGPVIVEQMDTTTVIPPGWVAGADRRGALILTQGDCG